MFTSIAVYLSFVIFCLLLVYFIFKLYLERKIDKLVLEFLLIFPMIIFVIFVGFRYDVGIDFNSYSFYYDYQDVMYTADYSKGFYIFIDILKSFNFDSQSFFVATSLIQVFLITRILRIKEFNSASFFILLFYFIDGSFLGSLNVVRQSIALLCCILVVNSFQNKNILSLFFYSVVAYCFHKSALYFLPLLCLFTIIDFKDKVTLFRNFVFVLTLLSVVFSKYLSDLMFLSLTLISSLVGDFSYSNYLVSNENGRLLGSSNSIGGIIRTILDLGMFYYAACFYSNNSKIKLYFFTTGISLIILPLINSSGLIFFQRSGLYFTGMQFVLSGLTMYYLLSTYKSLISKCFSMVYIVFYFIWFLNALYSSASGSTPYQTSLLEYVF